MSTLFKYINIRLITAMLLVLLIDPIDSYYKTVLENECFYLLPCPVPYYNNSQVFIWSFLRPVQMILICIACFITIPILNKTYIARIIQIIPCIGIIKGVFEMIDAWPIQDESIWYLDYVSFISIVALLLILEFVYSKYVDSLLDLILNTVHHHIYAFEARIKGMQYIKLFDLDIIEGVIKDSINDIRKNTQKIEKYIKNKEL